jgi:hypothetical protein
MQLANWSSSAPLNDRASAAREQEGLGIAERLVLPLHGAPPLLDKFAVEARQRINDTLSLSWRMGERMARCVTVSTLPM